MSDPAAPTPPSLSAAPLRVAIDLAPVSAPGNSRPRSAVASLWRELTVPPTSGSGEGRTRISAPYLAEAQRRAAHARRRNAGAAVFVDVHAHIADTVSTAFSEYKAHDPRWFPGRLGEDITYVGTHAGLASLVWDIWAARIADGVTLRSHDPQRLLEQFHQIVPWLAAKGVNFAVGQPAETVRRLPPRWVDVALPTAI